MPPAVLVFGVAHDVAAASARVSIGKISLTVRYAADAPADAKKKITHQATVCVTAVSVPFLNRNAVMISSAPERM
jgi:hypothetical protein